MSLTFEPEPPKELVPAPDEFDDGMERMEVYRGEPSARRRDKQGNLDPRCPDALMGPNAKDYYVAIVTSGENHHPLEDSLMDRYVHQQVAKKNGTYKPLEDPPVMLCDLLPRVFVLINRIFSERELVVGGSKTINDYCEKLRAFCDWDIIPVYVGKEILVLPLHIGVPKKHRDPILHAHMESYYKTQTADEQAIMNRVAEAQKQSREKRKEFIAMHKARAEEEKRLEEEKKKESQPPLEE